MSFLKHSEYSGNNNCGFKQKHRAHCDMDIQCKYIENEM